MKLITFKDKISNWDFKYKGYEITILPDWGCNWKTCTAISNKNFYRWTEEEVFNFLNKQWKELQIDT
jgi:hypothetical protein